MSPDKAQQVVAEAQSWVGTPYHPHAQVKGVGVDCAQLLIGVYTATGLIPLVEVGEYSTQWHLHRAEELFLGWVERYADQVPEADVQPGDVVLYRFGRTYSHGAVVVQWPMIVHAWQRSRAVILDNGADGLCAGRTRAFYRIREQQ